MSRVTSETNARFAMLKIDDVTYRYGLFDGVWVFSNGSDINVPYEKLKSPYEKWESPLNLLIGVGWVILKAGVGTKPTTEVTTLASESRIKSLLDDAGGMVQEGAGVDWLQSLWERQDDGIKRALSTDKRWKDMKADAQVNTDAETEVERGRQGADADSNPL